MADLVCACEQRFRSVCEGLPVDNEYEGTHYCVLHSPAENKELVDFRNAIQKKLKNGEFDFRGVYFPADWSFDAATFGWASFGHRFRHGLCTPS